MFGRHARLPLDTIFGIEVTDEKNIQMSYAKYVERWETAMKQAFQIVSEQLKKRGDGNKEYYDKKVRGLEIEVGDRVLLRNMAEKGGTGKLRNYRESMIYVVVYKEMDIPVFTIKPESVYVITATSGK